MSRHLFASLLIISTLPHMAFGAATVSSTSSNNQTNSSVATLDTSNFTVATNEAVVGYLMVRNSSISGVTANWDPLGVNEALTEVASLVVNSAITIKVFARLNPTAVSSKPIVFSWTGSGAAAANGQAIAGMDTGSLSTTFCNVTTASGTGTTLAVTVSSQTNNLTVDYTVADSAAATLSAPTQTQRILNNSMASQSFGASSAAGASSNTHQWTASTSTAWGAIGINIAASGQACSTAPPKRLLLGVF